MGFCGGLGVEGFGVRIVGWRRESRMREKGRENEVGEVLGYRLGRILFVDFVKDFSFYYINNEKLLNSFNWWCW